MRPRRGYVLLVTLGLLVLSTTLLVAIGRSASRHVAQARLDEQSLQRKWGLTSCRVAVLPSAEQVLSTLEQNENRPAALARVSLRLGNDSLTLVISDEQAKANVNEMLARMPADSVESHLREAMSGTLAFAHVRLRPTSHSAGPSATSQGAAERIPPVSGLGQLFDDVSPKTLLVAKGEPLAPIDVVTCWGDGQLNLLRASRESMRMALAPSLSPLQVERLISARDATVAMPRAAPLASGAPRADTPAGADAVQRLLNVAKVAPADRARLPLSTRSTCHSLLIELNDGRRVWYDFATSDESSPRQTRIASVAW